MSRFIFLAVFFIVVAGLVLHFDYQIPWLSEWIGNLPGDMTIKKGNVVIYIPLATSLLCSVVLSFVLSLLFKPSK